MPPEVEAPLIAAGAAGSGAELRADGAVERGVPDAVAETEEIVPRLPPSPPDVGRGIPGRVIAPFGHVPRSWNPRLVPEGGGL